MVDTGAQVPVVAIDPHAGPAHMPTVDSDNLQGAHLATEHLLALGHRRIGFLAGREDLESSRLREAGYRAALAAAGVEVDESLVRVADYRQEGAAGPARALLALAARPTAVFAANDLSAIGTMQAAAELGLSVPDDLSVVGFDNVPGVRAHHPPADHGQPAHAAHGLRGRHPAHPADVRHRAGQHPRPPARRARRARLDPPAV